MTRYITLADYRWLAEQVTGTDAAVLAKASRIDLADSAPAAGRRAKKRAAIAVGHSILVAAFHILDRGQPYHDLGGDWFLQRYSTQNHVRRLVAPSTSNHLLSPVQRCHMQQQRVGRRVPPAPDEFPRPPKSY